MEKSTFTREYDLLRKLLRQRRRDAGISQVELAEKLQETQSFISKCERGERRLDLVQLRLFCQALKIDFREFVSEFDQECRRSAD